MRPGGGGANHMCHPLCPGPGPASSRAAGGILSRMVALPHVAIERWNYSCATKELDFSF